MTIDKQFYASDIINNDDEKISKGFKGFYLPTNKN